MKKLCLLNNFRQCLINPVEGKNSLLKVSASFHATSYYQYSQRVSVRQVYEKHFLTECTQQFDTTGHSKKVQSNSTLKLIEQEQISLAEFLEQYSQVDHIVKYVEKHPESLLQMDDKLRFKLNIIKGACKHFRDRSHEEFEELCKIIDDYVEKKGLSEEKEQKLRTELVSIQPKLIYYMPHVNGLDVISMNGMALEFVCGENETLQQLYEITALQQNGLSIQFVKEDRLTEDYLTTAFNQNPKAIKYFPKHSKNDIKFLLKCMHTSYGDCYEYLPEKIRNLYQFAEIAVHWDGLKLKHVPTNMSESEIEQLFKVALTNNFAALKFTTKKFQLENREFLIEGSKLNPIAAISFLVDEYMYDREMILICIQSLDRHERTHLSHFHYLVKRLQHSSSPLLFDEEIMHEIVLVTSAPFWDTKTGIGFEIGENDEFLQKAILERPAWFYHASLLEKVPPELIKPLIQKHGLTDRVSEKLLHDEEILKYSTRENIDNIYAFPPQFVRDVCNSDRDFENYLVEWISYDNYEVCRYLSDRMRNDKDFAIQCVQQEDVLCEFSDQIRNDPEIVHIACQSFDSAIGGAGKEILQSLDFLLDYLERSYCNVHRLFDFIPKELLVNEKLISKLISKSKSIRKKLLKKNLRVTP